VQCNVKRGDKFFYRGIAVGGRLAKRLLQHHIDGGRQISAPRLRRWRALLQLLQNEFGGGTACERRAPCQHLIDDHGERIRVAGRLGLALRLFGRHVGGRAADAAHGSVHRLPADLRQAEVGQQRVAAEVTGCSTA